MIVIRFDKGGLHGILCIVVVAQNVMAVAQQRLAIQRDGFIQRLLAAIGKACFKGLGVHPAAPFQEHVHPI